MLPTKASNDTVSNSTYYFANPHMQSPRFPIVDQIDADVRISAASVFMAERKFGRGAATLSLKDGVLMADLAELEFAKGGRCGGQFGFKLEDGVPRYTLRGKIESVELSLLSRILWAYDVVTGIGDITVDLKASGDSKGKIFDTASGKVSIRQPAGGTVGLDLRTLAATTRSQPQLGWGGAVRGHTQIDGMIADFSLEDGSVRVEKAMARAGDATLSIEGTLNLPEQVGDLNVWITHPVPGCKASRRITAASGDRWRD